jgi:hypothetical protein
MSGAQGAAAPKGADPVHRCCSPRYRRRARWFLGDQELPRATASSGVLAASATTAGAAVLRAAGVPLAVHGTIPLAAFAQLTVIAAVAGGLLMAVLTRRGPAPRRRFLQVTGLTALSCAAPAFADTTASKIALVALHLLAAAIIIPVLARRAG